MRLISPPDCPWLFLSTQPWRSNNGAGGNDVRVSLLIGKRGGHKTEYCFYMR